MTSELYLPDVGQRDDLGTFVARVVRLDQSEVVALRALGDRVVAWAPTPFEVLATRAVLGELHPPEVTVPAAELLAALTVLRESRVDPGSSAAGRWRAELPAEQEPADWRPVREVPAAELEQLAEEGLAQAREQAGEQPGAHGGAPDELLDRTVLTAQDGARRVQVPLRCLFALSGLGLLGGAPAVEPVRLSVTDSWLRLDTRDGAVVRRRRSLLPLVF